MKISLYSLSISDKNPEEVVRLAREYGCDGIEWWCKEGGHLDAGDLAVSSGKIAALMKNSGLKCCGLAPYFNFSETAGKLRPVFEAAKTIGAAVVRSHSYLFTGEISVSELLAKQRRWLEETVNPLLEEFSLKMVIEQHHYQICCTPNACRQLVEGLPEERFGVIFDPGNSLCEGYTRPEYALSVLGRYLGHVHVKSCRPLEQGATIPFGRRYPVEWGSLAEGDLDWKAIIEQLNKCGYQGFLSLEALDTRPSEHKLREDISFLKGLISGSI